MYLHQFLVYEYIIKDLYMAHLVPNLWLNLNWNGGSIRPGQVAHLIQDYSLDNNLGMNIM